jgi:hypothetical protein
MVIVDAALVLGGVGLAFYGLVRLLVRFSEPAVATRVGAWVTAHYDVKGVTCVVVQKRSTNGAVVLDEHVVAQIPVDDPQYDATFLAAMAAARERRALFEAEDD